MKSKIIIFGLGFISSVLLGLIFVLFAIDKRQVSSSTTVKLQKLYDPEFDGFVPDEETAIKIAKAIWLPVFGDVINDDDYIYIAVLKNDSIWDVMGTFPRPTLGTGPHLEIRKRDCKILSINHIPFY